MLNHAELVRQLVSTNQEERAQMKRMFIAAAASIGVAAGVFGMSTPAEARVSLNFSFGYPGPYYAQPYYPGPFYGSFYGYPPHQVCYPVVKVKKYVRHHRVHRRRVVVTVCRWSRGW